MHCPGLFTWTWLIIQRMHRKFAWHFCGEKCVLLTSWVLLNSTDLVCWWCSWWPRHLKVTKAIKFWKKKSCFSFWIGRVYAEFHLSEHKLSVCFQVFDHRNIVHYRFSVFTKKNPWEIGRVLSSGSIVLPCASSRIKDYHPRECVDYFHM
jgi:hypothetical protein